MVAGCKTVGSAYVGSNPTPDTPVRTAPDLSLCGRGLFLSPSGLCRQMPLEAAVCRWSRDIRGMDLADLGTQSEHDLAGVTVLEARSRVTQSRVYACVGDVVTVVEALGVDPEQYFDAVPGTLGDPRRGYPGA